MQISLLALHRLMMLATSVASFLVQRVPSDRTTRRALAPAARMAGIAVAVCEVYQVCAWLTPRATNGVPSFSTSWVPDTWRPGGVAAWAAVENSDVAPSATTAAASAAPDSRDLRDLMGRPRSGGSGDRVARPTCGCTHPPFRRPVDGRVRRSHNQSGQALSTARNASHPG